MAQVAKIAAAPRLDLDVPIRRFDTADLSSHGKWLVPKLLKVYPHLRDVDIAGWLRGVIENNSFLFLHSANAAGCFQLLREDLAPSHIVRERFVIVADEKHVDEGAAMYAAAVQWGRHCSATAMEVEHATDVPHDKIRAAMGVRLFNIERVVGRL